MEDIFIFLRLKDSRKDTSEKKKVSLRLSFYLKKIKISSLQVYLIFSLIRLMKSFLEQIFFFVKKFFK